MITKDDLLTLMLRECDLCIHLHGKVPPGGMEFRFTPAQRSTAELLRYLSFIGTAAVHCMTENSWEPYGVHQKAAADLRPEDFPAAMERQKADLRARFGAMKDADLAAKSFRLPWGETAPLGRAILALAHGSLVAYRMQLFLQAKAAGNAAIGTSNCWGGMDAPPKA